MMSKTGTIGYLGSFKVPEVVLGVNAFALAAQAVNPNIKVKLVMIDSWFDPAEGSGGDGDAHQSGLRRRRAAYRQPGRAASLEKKKLYGFGKAADMSRFAPHAQLTAIEDIWGPYYISRAQAMLDGKWEADDAWWGIKEGAVTLAPYNKALPANVVAASDKVINGYKDGSYDVFTGPIYDQAGTLKVPKGERMSLKDLATIDWYVKGVQS